MQTSQLNLNDLVTNLAKMLQRIIGEHIRLQLNLHPRLLTVCADAGMLDQVLMNLAVNARDAMPHGGTILVATTSTVADEETARMRPGAAPGNYATLIVRDSGPGISPEVLPHIFEPFFTTKEAGKGTGLGLATVFGIVKQHRGWIDIQNEPGKGASFFIHLPMVDEWTRESPGEASAGPAGGTETVLVAEDDPIVRRLTCTMLAAVGYKVLEAEDGPSACRIWSQQKESINLLLTDMVMPGGMTGQDLAHALRADRPGMKVIFTTGYSSDFAGKAIELGENEHFLQKPFAADVLAGVVRKALDS
jgi:CheY-like chemotaxis protein